MKLQRLAIAAIAAISGQAYAADLQPNDADFKLYVSGSSAIAPVLAGIFTQNCGADLVQYKSQAAAFGDPSDGASHNVYVCTVTGSDFGPAYVGKVVAVWKRDAGGSAQGIFPVATNTPIAFLDTTTCTSRVCTGTINVAPDAGISDLETSQFNNDYNRPASFAGQTTATSDFSSTQPVAAIVFGLIVNNRLYTQLQADQGTSGIPTVSSAAFFSLYSQGWNNKGWGPVTRTNPTNQVNICSRAVGSGTRGTAQIQFAQLPNNKFVTEFAAPSANTPGATRGGNLANAIFISEESSSGNVVSCVEAAETSGSGYAIGLVSADRDLSAKNAKFVLLDNQLPNRTAAKDGNYPWVFEAFYNVNKSSPNLVFANNFRDAFKKSSNIAAIPAAALNGIMAIPSSTVCTGASTSWVGADLTACSRVTRSGDSRKPLKFVKP